MKTTIFYLALILVLSHSQCSKGYQSVGKIVGYDLAMCQICGGFFIDIDSVRYNFDTLPATSNIVLGKETFPVSVKLDWTMKQDFGNRKWIEITRAEKY